MSSDVYFLEHMFHTLEQSVRLYSIMNMIIYGCIGEFHEYFD